MQAPDRLEPLVGWRVWDVVELDGELRLCSLNFWTLWLPGRPATAACRRALADVDGAGLPPHTAPRAGCTCGIYAARTVAQVLEHARRFRLGVDAVHRVVGRVSLWGEVVEAERGWRGEHAYPQALFVPAVRAGLPKPGRLPLPRRPIERIALELAVYGVTIEIIPCRTYAELGMLLEPGSPA